MDNLHNNDSYCTGLLLPGERKSVEPMAARLDPAQVPSLHQALHHFVATSPWHDDAVLAAVRERVLPALTRHGPITAWIIDDTGFPKKGTHSVGVARQYCGQLGKQENCQVAVSLSVANSLASLPIAFELYLPEDWASDPARRAKAGVPENLAFRTKPQIALTQIRHALTDDVAPGVILGDAGYGIDTDFRQALSELALVYVMGVQSSLGVWPPGCGPLPPKPWSGKGRPPKLWRRDAAHQPCTAKELALALPSDAWQTVSWRQGSAGQLDGRLAAVWVRPSHRDYWRSEPHAEEWPWPPATPGSATGRAPTKPSRWPQADHEPDRAQPTSPQRDAARGRHVAAIAHRQPDQRQPPHPTNLASARVHSSLQPRHS